MRIKRVRLQNFSSFADSDWIELGPGLNYFVGQNNSGKSALIRSLAIVLPLNPHRSDIEFRRERLPEQLQRVEVSFSGHELEGAWLRSGQQLLWPFLPQTDTKLVLENIKDFFEVPIWDASLTRFHGPDFALIGEVPYANGVGVANSLLVNPHIKGPKPQSTMGGAQSNLYQIITSRWKENVFLFDAQRYNVGRCDIRLAEQLSSSADNLPAVLFRLQGNSGDIFQRLVQHMRDIFPTVKNLSITSSENTAELEILVWPVVEQLHKELSSGLNESGTGLSQVLSILTVAMTFSESLIIIDEISSFLHPAAAKALVRILESHYPQHQYVISTHSPDVLSASTPSTVHLIRKDGFTSNVLKMDLKKVEDLRRVTNELGVSMTDVFAAERVIWVEGPTEELSFPYILEETREKFQQADFLTASAPQFTAVIATGDFAKRKRPELVFEIYERLSSAAATISSSAVFAFDREELKDIEIEDLQRRSKDRVLFLPRRHFECYLLRPVQIASVINSYLPDSKVTASDIEAYLEKNGGDKKFKASKEWNKDICDAAWLSKVDAAKLLIEMFNELTDARLAYNKRQHSFAIVKEILKMETSEIEELVNFVHELVRKSFSNSMA